MEYGCEPAMLRTLNITGVKTHLNRENGIVILEVDNSNRSEQDATEQNRKLRMLM